MSQRSTAFDATLLTFCPPGPPARTNVQANSCRGMRIASLTYSMAMPHLTHSSGPTWLSIPEYTPQLGAACTPPAWPSGWPVERGRSTIPCLSVGATGERSNMDVFPQETGIAQALTRRDLWSVVALALLALALRCWQLAHTEVAARDSI